jgi:hypothetical protein
MVKPFLVIPVKLFGGNHPGLSHRRLAKELPGLRLPAGLLKGISL